MEGPVAVAERDGVSTAAERGAQRVFREQSQANAKVERSESLGMSERGGTTHEPRMPTERSDRERLVRRRPPATRGILTEAGTNKVRTNTLTSFLSPTLKSP